MNETFREHFRARWVDMDFNQHMRNAAYLGCAEDTRMRFLDSHGWSMAQFMKLQIGPVVVEDKLTYRRELRLLQPFTVELTVAATTRDGRRMKVRNQFFREDGELCATVESVVLWFSIHDRKPTVPPPELKDLWLNVTRTDDFAWYD